MPLLFVRRAARGHLLLACRWFDDGGISTIEKVSGSQGVDQGSLEVSKMENRSRTLVWYGVGAGPEYFGDHADSEGVRGEVGESKVLQSGGPAGVE